MARVMPMHKFLNKKNGREIDDVSCIYLLSLHRFVIETQKRDLF